MLEIFGAPIQARIVTCTARDGSRYALAITTEKEAQDHALAHEDVILIAHDDTILFRRER